MKKDKKKIIFLASGGAAALIIVAMAIIASFRMYPEFFGYPADMFLDKNAKKDSLTVEKTINLSESKLKSIESELGNVRNLEKIKNQFLEENNMLRDSLKKAISYTSSLQDSLKKDEEANGLITIKYNSLTDTLKQIKLEQEKALNTIDQLNKQITAIMANNSTSGDSSKIENFKTYAKMYNNSKPEEIAKILEKIDPSDASRILKLMQAKKAGKIIEAMDPKIAAAVLLLGVE